MHRVVALKPRLCHCVLPLLPSLRVAVAVREIRYAVAALTDPTSRRLLRSRGSERPATARFAFTFAHDSLASGLHLPFCRQPAVSPRQRFKTVFVVLRPGSREKGTEQLDLRRVGDERSQLRMLEGRDCKVRYDTTTTRVGASEGTQAAERGTS